MRVGQAEITLNCLIVPIAIGKLMNIPCIKVMQSITIYKTDSYRELETVIQSRVGAPFNKIPLKFCIIQTRSSIEKEMDGYDLFDVLLLRSLKQGTSISLYNPGQNNLLYHVALSL